MLASAVSAKAFSTLSIIWSLASGLLPLELFAARERQRRDDVGVEPCTHIIT
jgi:hypothetical protein